MTTTYPSLLYLTTHWHVFTVILGHEIAFRVQTRLRAQHRFLVSFKKHVHRFNLVVECSGCRWEIRFIGVVENDVIGEVNWFLKGISMMALIISSA